jgi:hypothetical protein
VAKLAVLESFGRAEEELLVVDVFDRTRGGLACAIVWRRAFRLVK